METPNFFRVSKSELITYLLTTASISWPVWLAAGLGVILTLVGALMDLRIMIVGLIVFLTVVPMMSFFIYFSNILDSHIMINILPHTVESKPGGFLVRIYREDRSLDKEGNEAMEWVETGRMTIFEWKIVKRAEHANCSVLYLVDSPVKVLYIPKGLQPEPVSCEIHRHYQFS